MVSEELAVGSLRVRAIRLYGGNLWEVGGSRKEDCGISG